MSEQLKPRFVSQTELDRQAEFADAVLQLKLPRSSYYIRTFGCQLNENDSEKLAGLLESMGYRPAAAPEEASFIIFNTCSVRENADDRFFGHLGLVKNLRRDHPDLLVAVCGCMMKIEEHVDKIRRSYPFVDLVFGPSDIYRLPELLYRRLSGSRRVYDVSSEDLIAEGSKVVRERQYRALCTIMYGCNNYCSYCVVPYTRGRERSRKPAEILQELKNLGRQGFGEVMLLGQNVNSYGRDLTSADGRKLNYDFADLLAEAAEQSDIPRIRFMTSHPKDISIKLLDVMRAYPQIERHLHLPLQSGSDTILKKMNRHYTVADYRRSVMAALERMPDLALSTDIIVGFPGETEQDFQATLDCVAEFAYDSAYTFQYSPRYGTPAALLAEQLSPEVMTERFGRLVELQNANSLKANEQRVGQIYEVLVEGCSDHRPDMLTGRASDNHLINFSISPDQREALGQEGLDDRALGQRLEGSFARVKVTLARTFSLEGEWQQLTRPAPDTVRPSCPPADLNHSA
ncbi:tRNA (N6-isopentenyl adenosine(37)-C2)-methylthiotransferase MiaB [Oscillospiraceae bacterium HV4-5-C5C]|nr:tRNA (N6-isopentenyl adenosine(37)-C2)-methylthiotransferase MiaB [Oscillospiraceae bacterium HV4-5-C5C]